MSTILHLLLGFADPVSVIAEVGGHVGRVLADTTGDFSVPGAPGGPDLWDFPPIIPPAVPANGSSDDPTDGDDDENDDEEEEEEECPE